MLNIWIPKTYHRVKEGFSNIIKLLIRVLRENENVLNLSPSNVVLRYILVKIKIIKPKQFLNTPQRTYRVTDIYFPCTIITTITITVITGAVGFYTNRVTPSFPCAIGPVRHLYTANAVTYIL